MGRSPALAFWRGGCGTKSPPPAPPAKWRGERRKAVGSGPDGLVGGDGGDVEDLADAAVHGDELDGVGEADQEGADGAAAAEAGGEA